MILFLSFVLYIVSFPRTISPIREARAFTAAKRQRRRQSFGCWVCVSMMNARANASVEESALANTSKGKCERDTLHSVTGKFFRYTAVDAFLPDNTTTASELSGGDQLSHRIKDIQSIEKEEMWNSDTYTTHL